MDMRERRLATPRERWDGRNQQLHDGRPIRLDGRRDLCQWRLDAWPSPGRDIRRVHDAATRDGMGMREWRLATARRRTGRVQLHNG